MRQRTIFRSARVLPAHQLRQQGIVQGCVAGRGLRWKSWKLTVIEEASEECFEIACPGTRGTFEFTGLLEDFINVGFHRFHAVLYLPSEVEHLVDLALACFQDTHEILQHLAWTDLTEQIGQTLVGDGAERNAGGLFFDYRDGATPPCILLSLGRRCWGDGGRFGSRDEAEVAVFLAALGSLFAGGIVRKEAGLGLAAVQRHSPSSGGGPA